MKRYFWFFLFGLITIGISAIIKIIRFPDESKQGIDVETADVKGDIVQKDTAIFALENLDIVLHLSNKWNFVNRTTEGIYGFLENCNDTVFCTSMSSYRLDTDIYKASNSELSEYFLQLFNEKYEKVGFIASYELKNSSGMSFKCFDYKIYERSHHFGTSTAILSSDKGSVIINFLALNEPGGTYFKKKEGFINILKKIEPK